MLDTSVPEVVSTPEPTRAVLGIPLLRGALLVVEVLEADAALYGLADAAGVAGLALTKLKPVSNKR